MGRLVLDPGRAAAVGQPEPFLGERAKQLIPGLGIDVLAALSVGFHLRGVRLRVGLLAERPGLLPAVRVFPAGEPPLGALAAAVVAWLRVFLLPRDDTVLSA